MQKSDVIEIELIALMLKHASAKRRNQPISSSTALYHDLRIYGDVAADVLSEVSKRYGISFSEFNFRSYFLPKHPFGGEYWAWRSRQRLRSLTVGHLLAVIEQGKWFEPESQAATSN